MELKKRVNFKLTAKNLTVDDTEKIMKFNVIAGFVGVPTDKTPAVGGKSGWKFMLSEEGASEAVKGLVGMGVNCCWHGMKEFAKHDKSFKIGVINEAKLEGNQILCSGYLWKCDFPDVCEAIKEEKEFMGASVELAAGSVEDDESQKVRIAKNIEFTGLSIVYRDKAAFYNTKFMCSVREEEKLTEQEIKDALAKNSEEIEKKLNDKITELSAGIADTVAKAVEAAVAGVKTELAAKAEEKKDEPEKKESDKKDEADLSAQITKAIADGFAALKTELAAKPEKKEEPARKTKVDFSAFERYGKDKGMAELSAEIDKDSLLSEEQKWATKLSLWQKSQQVNA